jgi:Uma2 family endonuclease
MSVSRHTFERVALEDPEGHWELFLGRLIGKPGTSAFHNEVAHQLCFSLGDQLSRREFVIRINAGRLSLSDHTFLLPDVFVIPRPPVKPAPERRDDLETYSDPALLVIEVWSLSTGEYDIDRKLRTYMERGDLEIWRVDTVDRSVSIWERLEGGNYARAVVTNGVLTPAALPGVRIDAASMFDCT